MKTIQIVKLPEGEAPVEIRQAWVGLRLPCDGIAEDGVERKPFFFCQLDKYHITAVVGVLRIEGQEVGTLSGKLLQKRKRVFLVNQSLAVQVLKQNYPQAAKWWIEHGFPYSRFAQFCFGGDEAIEIQPRDD